MEKLFKYIIVLLKGKYKLLVFLTLIIIGIPSFAQDFSQKFQRTANNNGYYRNLGNVGFPEHVDIYHWGINWYMDQKTYSSNSYPSVITGKIWTIVNVIDVPDSIKKEILDTMKKGNFETCFLWEFVFTMPRKITDWNGILRKNYLVVLSYGQETWAALEFVQAFSVRMETE